MLENGTIVAGHEIVGVLGHGGMGVVYEAKQLSLQRTVALKVLAASLSTDLAFRQRFRREGRMQAALDHPHIVTVFDFGESEFGLYLTMQLVRGPSLRELIAGGPVDTERVLALLGPVARALDSAHDAGLIHRDLKPENVLIGPRDHSFLADFGLTKGAGATPLTKNDQFLGTLDYVSPEQIRGEPATAKSDVYALGAVLYECLTGTVAFPRESDAAVLFAHISDPPPSVTSQRADLPAAIDPVVQRAMAKVPAERWDTAESLIHAATAALATAPRAPAVPAPVRDERSTDAALRRRATETDVALAPPSPAATPAPDRRAPARVPRSAIAAGAAVLGVAALTAGLLTRDGDEAAVATTVSRGDLRLLAPGGWTARPSAPPIPGLRFARPISIARSGAADTGVVAGQVDAAGPTLLPAGFLRRLDGAPSRRDTVRLGTLQAYRYRDLRPRGFARNLTLYVVPNTGGVATVACFAPRAAAEHAATCDRIAGSLRLSGVRAFALGPSPSYASDLNTVLKRFDATRIAGRRRLRAADTSASQASAARALAASYDRARRSLRRLSVSPEGAVGHDAMLDALSQGTSAYRRLGRAAGTETADAYAAAATAVRRSDAALARAFRDLREVGYRA